MNQPAPASKPRSRLNVTTLIVIAAFVAAAGLWLGNRHFATAPRPDLSAALLYPQPRVIDDFNLTQPNGKPLTLADWRGHWNLVYFGYTTCPDVCPTTLATLKSVAASLKTRNLSDRLQIDFISVDPERDTPEVLSKYVAFFNPEFIAATGSDAQLTPLSRSLGLIYSRSTSPKGLAEVDHSSSVVIIDPQGRMAGLFRPPLAAAQMAGDLAALIQSDTRTP